MADEAVAAVRDDVMAWKRFPHYWIFVRGTTPALIKGQQNEDLMFYLFFS